MLINLIFPVERLRSYLGKSDQTETKKAAQMGGLFCSEEISVIRLISLNQ
jgi:hypothetical protein